MARVQFGRSATVRGYNPMENTLKPGYIIKLRGKFYAVDSVEGLTYDVVVTAQGNTNGTEVDDAYDSGYFEDEDLEPFRNHLYCLVPCLYRQPKFISRSGTYDGVGFPNDTTVVTVSSTQSIGGAARNHVGDISGKVFLKHPAGVQRWSADSSPEADKTGFIDVNTSPVDDPNPNFAIWIESSESMLPNFRFLNDTGESLYYPVIHLVGFKARLKEMSPSDIEEARRINGGRLVYKLIVPQGLPYAGAITAETGGSPNMM